MFAPPNFPSQVNDVAHFPGMEVGNWLRNQWTRGDGIKVGFRETEVTTSTTSEGGGSPGGASRQEALPPPRRDAEVLQRVGHGGEGRLDGEGLEGLEHLPPHGGMDAIEPTMAHLRVY